MGRGGSFCIFVLRTSNTSVRWSRGNAMPSEPTRRSTVRFRKCRPTAIHGVATALFCKPCFPLRTRVQYYTMTLHLPACAARANSMYKALLCCSVVYSEQADTETARLGGAPRV